MPSKEFSMCKQKTTSHGFLVPEHMSFMMMSILALKCNCGNNVSRCFGPSRCSRGIAFGKSLCRVGGSSQYSLATEPFFSLSLSHQWLGEEGL